MTQYDIAGQYGMSGFPSDSSKQSNGTTFYVDGNAGGAGNSGASGQGLSWTTPYSTINYAVSQCTNNGGDVILVAANHPETIADTSPDNASGSVTDELCIDKVGVTVLGMGTGTTRPTITLGGATDATVEIRAADITFKNFIVVSNLVDVAVGINITNAADGILIENCEIRDGGTNILELVLGIKLTANSDDVTIRGCTFITTAAGSGTLSAIETAGAAKRLRIYDNVFMGDWNNQVMNLDAAKITDLYVCNNKINSLDSAGVAIDTDSTSTGIISENTIHTGSEANAIIAAACVVGPNYVSHIEGDLGGVSNSNQGGALTATKTYTDWTAAKHTLFNIVGGPVRVNYIVGVVMATIKATASNLNLDATTTDPGGDLAIASALEINADAVGTLYTVNGTFGSALVATTVGAVADTTEGFFMNIGSITMEASAEEDGSGSIQWTISYVPLHPGAHIVPAATD